MSDPDALSNSAVLARRYAQLALSGLAGDTADVSLVYAVVSVSEALLSIDDTLRGIVDRLDVSVQAICDQLGE